MAKITIKNMDFTSIKEVENMPFNWFVIKGNLFTNWKDILVAAVIASREKAHVVDKSNLIDIMRVKYYGSGVISKPLK